MRSSASYDVLLFFFVFARRALKFAANLKFQSARRCRRVLSTEHLHLLNDYHTESAEQRFPSAVQEIINFAF